LRWSTLLGGACVLGAAGVGALAVAWLAVFGMELTAATLAVQGAAVLAAGLVGLRRRRGLWVAAPVAVLVVLTTGVPPWLIRGLPDPIVEFQDEMAHMDAALAAGRGLTTRHAVGVYGLNLVMGFGGCAVGYREVARETLVLCVPPDGEWPHDAHLRCQRGCPEDCPDGPPPMRRYESDFVMGSDLVREAVCAMVPAEDPAGADGPRPLERRTVSWSMHDYLHDSARVGLAVNSPFCIRGTATPAGDRWELDLIGSARVWYPAGGYRIGEGVLSWRGRPLYLQEGVYADLHDRGWLHPYGVEWAWTVDTGGLDCAR